MITGGEPTLYGDKLINTCKFLKEQTNRFIKLDTNGSNPEVVKRLIDLKLVNYIALDLKSTIANYSAAIGLQKAPIAQIKETIELLKRSTIEHRFRTTYGHQYTSREDIEKIKEEFDVEKIFEQQFKEQ